MEAATERICSASWRENYHRSSNDPAVGRSERRILGSGTKILHKPPRYFDISPGLYGNQDGRQQEEVRKWSSASTAAAFQHWNVHPFKEPNSLAEYLVLQTDQALEFPIRKETYLSQIKGEVFLTSATRSVCMQDKVQKSDNLPQLQSESSPQLVKNERLSPVNSCSIKSEELSQSATTSPGLTTELENFQDLTAWCRLAPKALKMSVPLETDELNTPIIEFGDFVFQSPSIDESNCYGLLNVQNELIHSHTDGLYINDVSDIHINKHDNNIGSQFIGQMNYNNSNNKNETSYQYIINNIGGGDSKKNTKTTFMDSLNNIFTTKCADIYSINEDIHSQKQANDVFALEEVPPVFESVVNADTAIILPLEDETEIDSAVMKKNLHLDFSNIWSADKLASAVIDTPEVINTALALDKSFNLINFITNETNKEISIPTHPIPLPTPNESQLELEEESRSTSNDPDPSYTPSEASDDEDYEPPSKKNRKISTSRPFKKHDKSFLETSDSDISNLSNIEPVKLVRRGRPPKRNVSISSESTNADNDTSRYRELRDKNNEASRRSRLNRKMKENYLEEEAKDLDVRNRKLKVQVQEMERQVNTLRQNLMQMLLKK